MSAGFESQRNELEKHDHPSTYFVQNRKSEEELTRLTIQERLVTNAMGGIFPEQPATIQFHNVLDIGCGPAGWMIEVAQAYPQLSLVGIDISQRILQYGRRRVQEAGLEDRISLYSMDALRMLEFPDNSFDLVNLRFSVSYMRTWDWPKLLSEMLRVTRSGGIVRVTEPIIGQKNTSSALTKLDEMAVCALYRAGHLFAQDGASTASQLVFLLTQHGCAEVQTKQYEREYRSAEDGEARANMQNIAHGFQTVRPFIQKWGCLASAYDALYQQALEDMQRSDFRTALRVQSAWGLKPRRIAQFKR